MDKLARFILKTVGYCLAVAAAVCVLIGFWDEMCQIFKAGLQAFRKKVAPEYDIYDEEIEQNLFED